MSKTDVEYFKNEIIERSNKEDAINEITEFDQVINEILKASGLDDKKILLVESVIWGVINTFHAHGYLSASNKE